MLILGAFRYYLRTDLFACSTTEFGILRLEEGLASGDSIAFWTEVYREGYTLWLMRGDYVVGHLYLGMHPEPIQYPGVAVPCTYCGQARR